MLHATVLAIVATHDIYLEVAEGKLDEDWKLQHPVDFWTFCDVLSVQMLEYDLKKCKYPVGEAMRVCTKQSKRNQARNNTPRGRNKKSGGRPSVSSRQQNFEEIEFKKAKCGRGKNSRLTQRLVEYVEMTVTLYVLYMECFFNSYHQKERILGK